MNMSSSDENEIIKIGKEIILEQVNNLVTNPSVIKQNGCAACHILFELVNKMHISELDATDLLSQILLHDPNLNDAFVEMVEDIHMKRRMMAIPYVLKSRNAKDKYIDSNFKNFLEEKSSELVNYGYDLVLRKLLISAIALEIAQNIPNAIITAILYILTGSKKSAAINSIKFIPFIGDFVPVYTLSSLMWIYMESRKRIVVKTEYLQA